MEAGGFKVRLDLSQFFADVRKFSCIYVDLSRDRQIADVVDRISELFGIERPLFLLDERFYLPESENVNALRDSNVVKILTAFHFQGKDSCSTTDPLKKNGKEVKYLGHEIQPEQVCVKNNKTGVSDNFDCHNLYQNGKVDSSSVSYTDEKAFHELCNKKRKIEESDKTKCTNNGNILQQDLEHEIHYQKKCKRKKEKVKKEVLNSSSLEPIEDELEEKNDDGTHSNNKNDRKKKRNKTGKINGYITEEKVVPEVLNHSSFENINVQSEQATCDSQDFKKYKKKRKEYIAPLDTHKSIDSEPLHSTNLKRYKKKVSQNDTETDLAKDESLSLSCEKTDTTFLTNNSQDAQKFKNESSLTCQNIDGLVSSAVENHDSIEYADSDFVQRIVGSTPTSTDELKIREVADFLPQDNSNIHNSILENDLDNTTNTVINTKPKRKRVRVRKHRKRNYIQNDNDVSLPIVVPQCAVLQSSNSLRKHIRFEEEMGENLKKNASNKEVAFDDDMTVRNNTNGETYDSEESPNVNVECTHEMTAETEVTDCPMKNSFEYSIPENLTCKNNTPSLAHQIPLHQQWAFNNANLNVDSKKSLQKLLVLGKQNSVPVVFERKSQYNNTGSVSESLAPVSKQNDDNKRSERTCFQNTTEVVDLGDMTCLKTNPNAIDPLRYPRLEGKPKKNDIIAFKMLKLTNSYTPEISGYIIATVRSICENTLEMLLQIEVGESDLEAPRGKFSLEIEDSEKTDNDSKLHQLNWNELMDVRILFP